MSLHHFDIQVRFGDTDQLGHLNNAVYATYTESARLDFAQALGLPITSLILARLAMDYRRQVRYGDAVRVESWVNTIGRSSFGIAQRITANGELAVEVESVVVFFDYGKQSAQPIPAPYRLRLEGAMASVEAIGAAVHTQH